MFRALHMLAVIAISSGYKQYLDDEIIDVFDLTHPTTWKHVSEYYMAVEKHWKICVNCGIPQLGTVLHLEPSGSSGSMQPAIIPNEYLLTRLSIIDVSVITKLSPELVLTLDVALQWPSLKHDPHEPTLLLFKFGWNQDPISFGKRNCGCKVPGISYEIAEYISTNLSHVVGVATDAPTLESEQTREFTTRTVSNMLGKAGIYMIENVNLRRKLPDRGCMSMAMPLKMLNANYVPTRLTAFCPMSRSDNHVVVALRSGPSEKVVQSRVHDVNLDEIMS